MRYIDRPQFCVWCARVYKLHECVRVSGLPLLRYNTSRIVITCINMHYGYIFNTNYIFLMFAPNIDHVAR